MWCLPYLVLPGQEATNVVAALSGRFRQFWVTAPTNRHNVLLVNKIEISLALASDSTMKRRKTARLFAQVPINAQIGKVGTGNQAPFVRVPALRRTQGRSVFSLCGQGNEGASKKHQSAITGSQIAHPNEESGTKGMIGVPYK